MDVINIDDDENVDWLHPRQSRGEDRVATGKKHEIQMLLGKLERANRLEGSRSSESRHIRIELRKLGHYGGLRTAA